MAERPMEHFTVDGVNIFEVTDAKARQDVSNLKDDFDDIGLSVVDGALNITYTEVAE